MGDFNAHHAYWEPSLPAAQQNHSGSSLADFLAGSASISLLTPPDLHTRIDPATGRASTLDLCLGSGTLSLTTITTGPYMGSDHLPVILNFPSPTPLLPSQSRPRWSLRADNWDSFFTHLSSKPIPASLPPTEAIGFLTDTLVEVGTQCFTLRSAHLPRMPRVPWWSRQCEAAVRAKRWAFNAWRRRPTLELRRRFRQLEARCRRTILSAKRASWSAFCASLDFSTSVSSTWRFFRKMVRPQPPLSFPLHHNGAPVPGDAQKVEHLATHFHTRMGTPDPVPPPLVHPLPSRTHPIAQPFTPHELSAATAALSAGKSTGADNIPNEFLKRLPNSLSLFLLQIFNDSWLSGSFPHQWRHAITLPIPKPGKDPSLPSSYRPISLLSCISKLFEHLVLARLSWWLESRRLLPPNMSGFRPHRSALDTLLQLEHLLQEGFTKGHYTLVAFLDLEGAFDFASHNAILSKLSSLGLFGKPLDWVRSFLSSRTFSVAIGNTFSQPYPVTRGVPQGSPLSPLLFNILLSDFPSPPNSHTFLYADDLSLLCSSPSLLEAETFLQRGLDIINHWCTRWGLTLCAPKSCLMCFTRRLIPNIPQVHLTGTALPFRTTHRFLGLVLDGPRLTWKRHIQNLKTSCLPRLDLMRALAGVKWGASRATLMRFYITYIRSKLDYGCEVYGSASPSLLRQLEVVQNTALRIALGAFRSSPILALQAEAGLPSLDHRRNTKTVITFHKITASPPHHSLYSLLSQHQQNAPHPPLTYSPHTPFITRALSLYVSLPVTPLPFSLLERHSPLGPWFPFSSIISLHLSAPWTKDGCPELGKALFLSLLSTKYKDTFFIFTDGSHIPSPPSTSAAIYLPSRHTTTNWKLHPKTTILGAELFAIREGLTFALSSLPHTQPISLFTDSLTALQLLSTHRPHTHHTLCFNIHTIIARLSSGGRQVHLQWVPSHIGIVGNTVADRAANLAHSHPHPINSPPDHSDMLTSLRQTCHKYWDTRLTADLRQTNLGRYRHSSAQPWRCYSPSRPPDIAIVRLRIGHTRLNSHLHRLNIVQDPHCPWCPTQLDTPEHLLLWCPRFHSMRVILKAALAGLNINRPTIEDILGSDVHSPKIVFQIFKYTATFLEKTGQIERI